MNKCGSFSTNPLEWFYSSSVSEVVLNAAAKCASNQKAKKKKKKNTLNSVPVVEDGVKGEVVFV